MARKEDYIPTDYPGIKQRKSDGKYIVTIDLGRQMKLNKKTGEMEMRQCKTTKIVPTLKEAKALTGKNNAVKRRKKVSRVAGKVLFSDAIDDFLAFYDDDWGNSHRERQASYARRCKAYLGKMDVRDIDTRTIEEFFKWCKEDHSEVGYGPIIPKTIQKIKSMLSKMWRFMKKSQHKYGVTENVVMDAEYGKVDAYEAAVITPKEYSELLEFALKNELDYSNIALVALLGMAGLRRGEVCGLQWKDILWDKKLIDVRQQRAQRNVGWEITCPKNGDPDGKTRAERRQRYAALPDKLAAVLRLVAKQQEIYQGHKIKPDEYVYRQKVDIVNNVLCNPRVCDRRFNELQTRYNKIREKQEKEPLPHLRNHDLRHTLISMCINNGVDRLQVSCSVGHRPEGNTTITTYWHDDNNRAEMIECIDRLITTEIVIPNMEAEIYRKPLGSPEGRVTRNNEL